MEEVELDHQRGGAGDALVLIHGIGHTWRGWRPMLPLLEASFDVPRQGRRFERLIPGAGLRYLKGLGHVPMSDDPELLAGAIADFTARAALSSTPGPGPPAAAPA